MNTVTQNPRPQILSQEDADALLDQFSELDDEQKKVFLLEHRELFAFVNRTLVYDQVISVETKLEA